MNTVKVNALMIRSVDYQESDKIVTLLTAEYGKITAKLRGVRKNGAKLKFAAQPFCFAEYVLAEKQGRYTVTSAAQTDGFYELREDIIAFYCASAVCEVCDKIAYEGTVHTRLFLDAVWALRDMANGTPARALTGFLWNALQIAGYALDCGRCVLCGENLVGTADKICFDFESGGFTCGDCRVGARVSASTMQILQSVSGIYGGKADALPDGERRAIKLLYRYFLHRTEERIASIEELLSLLAQ